MKVVTLDIKIVSRFGQETKQAARSQQPKGAFLTRMLDILVTASLFLKGNI